ncbi:hypothetical protein [Bacillus norwichensis]|uniref:Uncharacterized protein n=1 Tax=Bacillus norwichensis TaxID=2762217 RepID=A0ABR8VMS4_9BACI|nr:hypothetical protein [Bacillus norwichensis]MBD8006074.1 hypothetical protein [Bacillus norwichensis]
MNKNIILKSVGLGVGVAALVLNIMEILEIKVGITLLSIGLICLAISNLENKKK